MNILFDLSEAQSNAVNGAAEYAQTVLLKLLDDMNTKSTDVSLYGLYDSRRKFLYTMMSPENLLKFSNVSVVDSNGRTIKDIIIENKIDLFFTPCLQLFCDNKLGDLTNLPCKVVCVIHDMLDEEMSESKMFVYQHLSKPYRLFRHCLSRFKNRLVTSHWKGRSNEMQRFLSENDADIVTVSNYTEMSIRSHLPEFKGRVHVWWSPMKSVCQPKETIDNADLAKAISRHEKYFLIVSANRPLKNADKMIRAFAKFVRLTNTDYKLITVGGLTKLHASHLSLPYLSASDLEQAYKHCHALLYPSVFEGFGYPPLEAMKYGKPVLCSNVCSMPEVLGDAPIYFSPIYETEMIAALCNFHSVSYNELSKRNLLQYETVSRRQNNDLQSLTNFLIKGKI